MIQIHHTKMDKSSTSKDSYFLSSIHCKQCNYKGSKNGLQQHLRTKANCFNQYTKKDLRELDIHQCQNCEYKGSSFGIYNHLKTNPHCSKKYPSWMLHKIKKRGSRYKKANIVD